MKKKKSMIKIAAAISMLSVMTNAYSFEELDNRVERSKDLRTLSNHKGFEVQRKEVQSDVEGLFTKMDKFAKDIRRIIRDHEAYVKVDKTSGGENGIAAARRIQSNLTTESHAEAIFLEEKLGELETKGKPINDAEVIVSYAVNQVAKTVSTEQMKKRKFKKRIVELNKSYNLYEGKDENGDVIDGKANYGLCDGRSDIDRAIYKYDTDLIMKKYEENLTSLIENPEEKGSDLQSTVFSFTDDDDKKSTLQYDPESTLKLKAKTIAKYQYEKKEIVKKAKKVKKGKKIKEGKEGEEGNEVAKKNTEKTFTGDKYILSKNTDKNTAELEMNKEVIGVLKRYNLLPKDYEAQEEEEVLYATKDTAKEIKSLMEAIYNNALAHEKDREDETSQIATDTLDAMDEAEERYIEKIQCFVDEESISDGKYSGEEVETEEGETEEKSKTVKFDNAVIMK